MTRTHWISRLARLSLAAGIAIGSCLGLPQLSYTQPRDLPPNALQLPLPSVALLAAGRAGATSNTSDALTVAHSIAEGTRSKQLASLREKLATSRRSAEAALFGMPLLAGERGPDALRSSVGRIVATSVGNPVGETMDFAVQRVSEELFVRLVRDESKREKFASMVLTSVDGIKAAQQLFSAGSPEVADQLTKEVLLALRIQDGRTAALTPALVNSILAIAPKRSVQDTLQSTHAVISAVRQLAEERKTSGEAIRDKATVFLGKHSTKDWRTNSLGMVRDANRYVESAAVIVGALGKIKGLETVSQKFAKAQSQFQQAQTLVVAYASGNPAAMLGAVNGLLGGSGGGSDSLAAEMVKGFADVLEALKKMEERINARLDHLQATAEQAKLYAKDGATEAFQSCIRFAEKIERASYDSIRRYFEASGGGHFETCRLKLERDASNHLRSDRGIDDQLPQDLWMDLSAVPKTQQRYKELWVHARSLLSGAPATLAEPASTVAQLGTVRAIKNDTAPPAIAMERLANDVNISWYAETILAIHPLYPLLVGPAYKRTLVPLASAGTSNLNPAWKQEALDVLTHGLKVVNLAIAQEALMSGEALIPLLLEQGGDAAKRSARMALWKLVVAAMDQDQQRDWPDVFRRNMGRYVVHKSGAGESEYHFGYSLGGNLPWTLRDLLVPAIGQATFVRAKDVWQVAIPTLPGASIPLPTWPDSHQVERTPALANLLRIRHRLVDDLAAYKVGEAAASRPTNEERQALGYVLVRGN